MPDSALLSQARIAAAAQNQFGMKLLAGEVEDHPRENVFLSPLSIFLALAMTENGAAGKTRTAMRDTLAVPSGLTEDAFQEAASALSQSLRSRPDLELSIANALWSDRSFQLADGFVKRARDYYDADAAALDFQNPEAAHAINAWVKQHTKGKIPEIVTPEIVRAAVAILTNAVYFRGLWQEAFPKSQTQDGIFHQVDGTQQKVPMMHQAGLRGAWRTGDGFEAARLPYRASGMAMYAILPAPGTAPEQAMAKIAIGRLIHSSDPAELDLRLPRFSLSYSTKLKDPLARLGMEIAFRYPGADFGPMGSSELYIGQVLHKTRLEVDEEGTVAAAATAVIMTPGAMRQRAERKTLIFDRPFGVMLCDEQTDAVLFAGVVYDPLR
jgi:serpin B